MPMQEEPGIQLSLDDFNKTKGTYKPKDLVIMVDEMAELTSSDDFRAVSAIKESIGSIARLGRAAGLHLVLAMQKVTSSTVSNEVLNNIHQKVVLGEFDSGTSTNMFEKDISWMGKPEIKGRGFSKAGNTITEFQSYYTTEDDFQFVDKTLFQQLLDDRQSKGIDPNAIPENNCRKSDSPLSNLGDKFGQNPRNNSNAIDYSRPNPQGSTRSQTARSNSKGDPNAIDFSQFATPSKGKGGKSNNPLANMPSPDQIGNKQTRSQSTDKPRVDTNEQSGNTVGDIFNQTNSQQSNIQNTEKTSNTHTEESKIPERTLSRADILDENGEIDYSNFL